MFFFKGLQIEKNGQSYETQLPKKEGIILVVSKSPMNFRGSHLRVAPGHLTSWESKDGPTPPNSPQGSKARPSKKGVIYFSFMCPVLPHRKIQAVNQISTRVEGFQRNKNIHGLGRVSPSQTLNHSRRRPGP